MPMRPCGNCAAHYRLGLQAAGPRDVRSSMPVSATVVAHASVVALELRSAVTITAADLARGYVDVFRSYRLRSNTLAGLLLQLSPRVGLTRRLKSPACVRAGNHRHERRRRATRATRNCSCASGSGCSRTRRPVNTRCHCTSRRLRTEGAPRRAARAPSITERQHQRVEVMSRAGRPAGPGHARTRCGFRCACRCRHRVRPSSIPRQAPCRSSRCPRRRTRGVLENVVIQPRRARGHLPRGRARRVDARRQHYRITDVGRAGRRRRRRSP